MPSRKPTRNEAQILREVNVDRDLKDMVSRLTNIEGSIKNIESRDAVIQTLQFNIKALTEKVEELEKAKTAVIRMVLGTVGVAILATVVGVKLT